MNAKPLKIAMLLLGVFLSIIQPAEARGHGGRHWGGHHYSHSYSHKSHASKGHSYKKRSRHARSTAAASGNGATAQCRDGTLSYSQHRRGTCSHHKGVAVWY